MAFGKIEIPLPVNEPVLTYAPGSGEREALQKEIALQKDMEVDIPLVIGGQRIESNEHSDIFVPHDHSLKLGRYHMASEKHVLMAIDAAKEAASNWARTPWTDRAAVFLKAAELLSTKYRHIVNAATMLGLSKTVHQAEIDSACELADFWRFNPYFMGKVYENQPIAGGPGSWNTAVFRPLEGFVLAVSPFNFAAIGGNLPTAPAMMGNVVLWKPASSAVLPAYYIMQILEEAGLPKGVINMLPGAGAKVGNPAVDHPDFAGLHFTGSTQSFNEMWRRIGQNISNGVYKSYPRIVGETGGKDFVLAAPDADPEALSVGLFRGAFEYQGQKCSAASRAYIPKSLWPRVLSRLQEMKTAAAMGDVTDFRTFMGAVISKKAFGTITEHIDFAARSTDAKIVIGGESDSSKGWFIQPTVIETTNPHFKTMEEEIFGPVLTVYVYEDQELDETLRLVDETSPYALTGAIFAKDRQLIVRMTDALEHAAGNFYINDKPTGAVVGQQPFGGGRGSGTNDKAGSADNLRRWCSTRIIKETFNPPTDFRYPHMEQ